MHNNTFKHRYTQHSAFERQYIHIQNNAHAINKRFENFGLAEE